tara:strand:- start:31 stop:213 length:183 start_codon:yes stop_codon:yes gene_type:complete
MKIYLIWLMGVTTWNFTLPTATPIEDVLVAILLSFLTITLKKILKYFFILLKNKYLDNRI